jgi:hypothetical protein
MVVVSGVYGPALKKVDDGNPVEPLDLSYPSGYNVGLLTRRCGRDHVKARCGLPPLFDK